MDIQRLAAFTDDPAGGNPAGVVVADALPDAGEMQNIAAAVGYSETAFLAAQGGGDDGAYVVRYFSPEAEVDFCGHATIAAGVLLGTQRGAGTYRLHTNVGVVPVEVARRDDGRFVDAGLVSPPVHLTISQGEDLGRPSTIQVHVPAAGGIRVTGTAVPDPV